jgi:two-component system, chemotaxis family, sensor kinase CheA
MSDEKNNNLMETVQAAFLTDIVFDLEQAEESYLKLENPEEREEELKKIFRLAHSLKGTGASVGFVDLSEFAHLIEDCLTILRGNTELIDNEVITVLLKSGDAIKSRIDMLKNKNTSPWNVESLKAEIRALTKKLEERAKNKTASPEAVIPFDQAESAAATEHQAATPSKAVSEKASIKIDAGRIESVLNIVGELVVTKSQLMNSVSRYHEDDKLANVVALIDKTVRELQESTLSMRMTPLKQLFVRVQRVAREVSAKLNKVVEIEAIGVETEIDRAMVDMLSDPLLHIIRNSVDHGIEATDQRVLSGKPTTGKIQVKAAHEGGRVVLRIKDDGKGMDRQKIIQKAIENKLVKNQEEAAPLSDNDVFMFICAPGFSTAEKVTDVSGRGVGMDVVRSNIEKMRGTLEIESQPGKGTTIVISLPLTLSITDGMILETNGRYFVLPVGGIRELLILDTTKILDLGKNEFVLNHRGRVISLIDIGFFLAKGQSRTVIKDGNMVILVEAGNQQIGLIVERVVGQAQVVLKSLGPFFRTDYGIVGGAVMGDGHVALVLDPVGLRQFVGKKTVGQLSLEMKEVGS